MRDIKNDDYEPEALILLTFSKGANSRKMILTKILFAPKNCNQLAIESKLEWWTVQKHIQLLMKKNIIESVKFGHITFYKLTLKGKKILTYVLGNDGSSNSLAISSDDHHGI